ncbi:SKI3 [Candida oxycetoniae]|uniref:SKI3 n=1 Tax=Candida oxycetoniae TaxID=497107 RepID=A0AAI9WWC2_9ASCO|nr:SKI3 [Candida oxycetoniae]KAI3402798.2 SKI3 [Candida oxycetoniae]
MSGVKSILKLAKSALEQNDPESALDHVRAALDTEPNSYYAYVFQGKAYQLLGDMPKAITAFKKATAIEPDNLLAWKGYLQLVKNLNDHEQFFSVLTSISSILVSQGISIADSLQVLREYLETHKMKNNDELYELYLRKIMPGTELGDLIGSSIENPETICKKLLDFKENQVEKEVVAKISKERVRYGRTLTLDQKSKLDTLAWSIYKSAKILELYDAFLNICNDDALRRKYQEKCLKFKYELLKVCPEKPPLIKDIRQSIDDMILLKTDSLFCWNLYFNWNDDVSVNHLDEDKIITYLDLFQNEGLGRILFAFVMSDISPYNKKKIVDSLAHGSVDDAITRQKKSNSDTKKDSSNLEGIAVDDDNDDSGGGGGDKDDANASFFLPQEEVISLMIEGHAKANTSVLANRIIVHFYIHLREYNVASERCREGIKILADIQRTFGVDLRNTKDDFLCSLAIVYTYYEAPKNFSRALQLYDKILESKPDDVRAKVGKGLIHVERGDLEKARVLLGTVLKDHPENLEAVSEYYWCLVKLGKLEEGRNGLKSFVAKITGADLHSREVRAIANWRIAKSFIEENDVQQCYQYLIQSLKDSDLYAPSYTLLGVLFEEHFKDTERARKCFYKAFDLDANEITAARHLVEQALIEDEWEVAQVLATRVIKNEHSRRMIMRGDIPDASWPYRVLGCAALNFRDDAKAVEWFQNALRIDSGNYACWVGLGEAYSNCGRFEAASKVFQHALSLGHQYSWTVKYMLGVVLCEMKNYNEGLSHLYSALENQPNEECIISAIYEANIENTKTFIQLGFFGRAINTNLKSLRFIKQATSLNSSSQKVWRALGDSLRVFIKIREYINEAPFDEILDIFAKVDISKLSETLDDSITMVSIKSHISEGRKVEALLLLAVLAAAASVSCLSVKSNKILKATAFYNLGLSLLEAFQNLGNHSYGELSVQHLKHAIKLEPNNSNYWMALANVYFFSEPLIAQHCYIKAISLETKNAEVWVNLAALYLKHDDSQLAQQTFLRAQSVTPQDAQSWLGNAIAAEASGDLEKASSQYAHAFILSKGRLALAQYVFGLSVLDRSTGRDLKDIETAQEFSISNQAMQSYLKYYPDDVPALNIALGIAERCKDFDNALKIGHKLSTIYEKLYEESESQLVVDNFASLKSQLSRLNLGLGAFEKSIEQSQAALDLCGGAGAEEEEEGDESSSIIMSSRITLGLAYFFSNMFQDAIVQLRSLLAACGQLPSVITLIAQVLYAHNTAESKQAAIDQLFAYIEESGSSLSVILTLGAISLVENLSEYLDAIKDELLGLNLNEIVSDTHREIPKLLDEINKRIGDNNEKIWLRYAYLFPSNYNIWKNINPDIAKQVVLSADNKVTGSEYAEAMIKTGKLRDIQRSLMMNPCSPVAIEALNMCF